MTGTKIHTEAPFMLFRLKSESDLAVQFRSSGDSYTFSR